MAGRFIVFEGIESDIITDHAGQVASWLRAEGLTVNLTREPTDGPIGAQLRLVLSGRLKVDELTRAALFLADRMDHLYRAGGILEDLEKGRHVICARYLLSSYAYQSAVAPFDWLQKIHQFCPWPDLAIFIDTPVDVCIRFFSEREGYDPEAIEQKKAHYHRQREAYLKAIEQCIAHGQPVETIDGNRPATAIHELCRRLVERVGLER